MFFFTFKGTSQNTQSNNIIGTIDASGDTITGSSGTVAYSIGQVFYTYIGQSDYIVAQGIQQQEEAVNLSKPVNSAEPETEIFIFPNPASDFVNIKMDGLEFEKGLKSYALYDLQGRLLKQNKIVQAETQVELSNLKSSIYLLTVYFNDEILKTFKIIKK